MILSALCDLQARLSKDPDSGMPRHGYSVEKIVFAIMLQSDGSYRFLDLREQNAKGKPAPRRMMVPAAVKRTTNPLPNFLWDKTSYTLGVDVPEKSAAAEKCFRVFCEAHFLALAASEYPAVLALCNFLRTWKPDSFFEWESHQDFLGQNCVFAWEATGEYLHDIVPLPEQGQDEDSKGQQMCLVTGAWAPIARIHPAIKGIWGGQSAGGALVSFNCDSFTSYGKEQSYTAPVSQKVAQAYVAALNFLLNRENKRCIQIGDASTVFWAEKPCQAENILHNLLGGGGKNEDADSLTEKREDDARAAHQVKSLLTALRQGIPVEDALQDINAAVRFYILGLAPNAARIAIRFWLTTSFGELAENVGKHVRDIAIVPQYERQPEFLSLWQLLVDVAMQGKSENIVSPMASAVARAMLSGDHYPQSFYMAAINRIRSTREVTYQRASILKGCLVRNYNKEISQMLDATRTDVPYCLGRLFAVLEKTQQDALGNINSTIRDKYIGSASATPKVVFPQLLRLAQHHIAKSDYGGKSERVIESIMQHVNVFPANLTNEEQGDFFIGFYHQRVANYTKTVKEEE